MLANSGDIARYFNGQSTRSTTMNPIPLMQRDRLVEVWRNFTSQRLDHFMCEWPGMRFLVHLEKGDNYGHIVAETCVWKDEPSFRVLDSSFKPIKARPDLFITMKWFPKCEERIFKKEEYHEYMVEVGTAMRWAVAEYERHQGSISAQASSRVGDTQASAMNSVVAKEGLAQLLIGEPTSGERSLPH